MHKLQSCCRSLVVISCRESLSEESREESVSVRCFHNGWQLKSHPSYLQKTAFNSILQSISFQTYFNGFYRHQSSVGYKFIDFRPLKSYLRENFLKSRAEELKIVYKHKEVIQILQSMLSKKDIVNRNFCYANYRLHCLN